jgi:hypothetical protein
MTSVDPEALKARADEALDAMRPDARPTIERIAEAVERALEELREDEAA